MQRGGTADSVAALARDAMARGLERLAAARSSGGERKLALRWLERAHRLVPHDPNATLTLASACLADDPVRAASLFKTVADSHDIRQAWLGLAAARLRLAGPDQAAETLALVLSRHAFAAEAAGLASIIGGDRGWCGLRSDGRLEIHAATSKPVVLLDGKVVRGWKLPTGWQAGRTVDVIADGTGLLGSPIQIAAMRRLAGCVEVCEDGIKGWAWHPADPDLAPVLTVLDPGGRVLKRFVAANESVAIADTGPLARPRSFRLVRSELAGWSGPVRVTGPDGKDLAGSPLNAFHEETAHVAAALRLAAIYPARAPGRAKGETGNPPNRGVPALRADAPVPAEPVGADGRQRGVTVVIPVHDGGEVVLDCLNSVVASVAPGTRILVVDDGSADPAVVSALDRLARRREIALLRHARALGFPAAANAGMRAADGRDIVLLNSDTLVPPGWVERLRAAAYSGRDIGTVTPLSNDASILSYPGASGTNRVPDQNETTRLDVAARRANGSGLVDIPVGVGFCLYLRRDCLNATGSFRADCFAQGYGEENDFCLRARRLGWRSVALTGLFVGHRGGASFGASASHLRARNSRIVEQLHPGYGSLIEAFLSRDPLADHRRRIDRHHWRESARNWSRSVILISHNEGGGVEQRLLRAVRDHGRAGRCPIVLRPCETAAGEAAVRVQHGETDAFPNLIYAIPRETTALLRLLRAAKPDMIEAHHLAAYPSAIYDVVKLLHIPYDVHVHDYAWICPRVSLLGAHDRYCGEPDLAECETCVADNGHFLKETISVAALRRRSAAFLSAARRVVVPSDDTGIRMRRHIHGLETITFPHEDDAAIAACTQPPPHGDAKTSVAASCSAAIPSGRRRGERRRREWTSVCVVGGIGVHKGYEVLLACARDAAARDLDLRFVVVGHTIDDARMLATRRVFITGRFEPDEAVSLIAGQNARLGFVASICPETWCLSLGDIWRAGLPAAAFDIGAPAERIRNTGRGILLPLGLSASAINNALVAVAWKTAQL